jgi:hypothetical protein
LDHGAYEVASAKLSFESRGEVRFWILEARVHWVGSDTPGTASCRYGILDPHNGALLLTDRFTFSSEERNARISQRIYSKKMKPNVAWEVDLSCS